MPSDKTQVQVFILKIFSIFISIEKADKAAQQATYCYFLLVLNLHNLYFI